MIYNSSNHRTAFYNNMSTHKEVLGDDEAVRHIIDEQQEKADRTTAKYVG